MRYMTTRKVRIEIIPMIDIMLFLLVFFAMMTLKMIPTSGHVTKLPTSSTAVTMPPPKLLVEISADGSLLVDGKVLTAQQLTALLRQRDNSQRLEGVIDPHSRGGPSEQEVILGENAPRSTRVNRCAGVARRSLLWDSQRFQ